VDGEDPSAPTRESILYLSHTYRLVSEICMLVAVHHAAVRLHLLYIGLSLSTER
jgi:hypothetical protein